MADCLMTQQSWNSSRLIMAEFMALHVGGCGTSLAPYVWNAFCQEHGINADGVHPGDYSRIHLERIGSFFNETDTLTYRPRALVVDTDPASIEVFRNTRQGRMFPPRNLIAGRRDIGDNWGRGFYVEGRFLCESAMEVIRKEAEACDWLQGFALVHGVSGGTGGGLGSLLLQKIKEEFPEKVMSTMSVISSNRYQHCIREPYNAVLTLSKLIKYADLTFLMDNANLSDVCLASSSLEEPVYVDINKVLAGAISGITSFLRFPGQLNGDLRKMSMNLVPNSKLHFLNTALSPIVHVDNSEDAPLPLDEMAKAVYDPLAQSTRCWAHGGRFLHLSCQFRGRKVPRSADKHMLYLKFDLDSFFIDCMPCNMQTSVCPVSPGNLWRSACFISNHTGIRFTLAHIVSEFRKNFDRHALLEMYRRAGVVRANFKEAETTINGVYNEYARAEQIDRRH